MEKARSYAADLMKIDPKFNLESWAKALPYKYPDDLEREMAMLRKAGFPEKPPLALPDKPSIAVLPFENMSGDAEQAYFAEGMTDDLITRLSQISGLFVIARNSTFAYKGTPVKVQDVARDLGVRYVLEGSVRKAENTIRINAQLIDAQTGGHLWAEIFDRQYRDIFAIQDEITDLIASALSVKLTGDEQTRLARAPTDNLEAYEAFLKAGRPIAYSAKALKEKLALFKRATELDPNFAEAYAADAAVAAFVYRTQWWPVMRPTEARARALEGVTRALALNPDTPLAHSTLGVLQMVAGKHEDAIRAARKAVSLAPNDTDARTTLAIILTYAGQPEAAITEMETVLRLDPKPPASIHVVDGFAHFIAGQYEQSLEAFLKAKAMAPNNVRHQHVSRGHLRTVGPDGRGQGGHRRCAQVPAEQGGVLAQAEPVLLQACRGFGSPVRFLPDGRSARVADGVRGLGKRSPLRRGDQVAAVGTTDRGNHNQERQAVCFFASDRCRWSLAARSQCLRRTDQHHGQWVDRGRHMVLPKRGLLFRTQALRSRLSKPGGLA